MKDIEEMGSSTPNEDEMTDETATNRQQQAENAVNDKEDEQRQSAEKDVAAEGDDKATDNTDDSTKEPSVEEQLEEAQLKKIGRAHF